MQTLATEQNGPNAASCGLMELTCGQLFANKAAALIH